MFTNERVLGLILILFIIGTAIYFTVTKFKQEINVSPSPSPTPQELTFILTQTPTPLPTQQVQPIDNARGKPIRQAQGEQPQPTELPLARNKYVGRFPGILREDIRQNKKAVIAMAKGMIELEIYPEASMAASNFMILSANGFYDNLTFHRVEDWVIQGGDPSGNGSGGPGYTFQEKKIIGKYDRGIAAMAKRVDEPPGTAGSQFFIMLKDTPLPPDYAVFGKVISGMDVVEKITPGDIMQKVTIENMK